MAKQQFCPCGSKLEYINCCQSFIEGKLLPQTPEQLMRSRYTAYSLANIDYIQETMFGDALQDFDAVDAKEWAQSIKWLKLEVIRSSMSAEDKGLVEFIAYYRYQNKKHQLHEVSQFELINQRWYYTSQIHK
jgi:SEC-C motif-containing protein